MRAVVQRVTSAAVTVGGEVVGAIGPGLCVLVGVGRDDEPNDAIVLAKRLVHLRIFDGAGGHADASVEDVGGEVLVVSQFTLLADTSRGRRPSFSQAASAEQAAPLVDALVAQLRDHGATVATGRFGAAMQVSLVNDGPFTVLLDTH